MFALVRACAPSFISCKIRHRMNGLFYGSVFLDPVQTNIHDRFENAGYEFADWVLSPGRRMD